MVSVDQLLKRSPEPCDTCTHGLMIFVSYDDVRRCRRCVTALVLELGWDQLHLPPSPKKKKRRVDDNQTKLL